MTISSREKSSPNRKYGNGQNLQPFNGPSWDNSHDLNYSLIAELAETPWRLLLP